MKYTITLLLLIFSFQVFSNDVVSCNLNRSYDLVVSIYKDSMTISKKHWASADLEEVANFKNYKMVTYGTTRIILGDHGRSGYFFLKVINGEGDWEKGLMDINLLGAEMMINTNGKTVNTYCKYL